LDLKQVFNERLQEIDSYLSLLAALERQVQKGPPEIGGSPITTQQQKILYSSVYLQLYNLVEATATWCIDAIAEAAADNASWKPGDLESQLRREWVRTVARTHVDLNAGNRLDTAVNLCEAILNDSPVSTWSVERGGGGNWDAYEIELISERLGCDLQISRPVESAAKRRIRNDKNSLQLVKDFRNNLAHGTISFEECGDGVTVVDLVDIKNRTTNYLREVISAFQRHIDNHQFIKPERRPYIGAYI
jgi:hypothetical protein